METIYYLPISSKCLAHYFGYACIMPSKYFSNKPLDIQNSFDEYLLLTTNLGTTESDCCIELVLTKIEMSDLIDIKKGYYLYQKPLPISRVKSILFIDKNQMEQTIVNISMSTAFIPKELIKVVRKFDSIKFEKNEITNKDEKIKNWSNEIKRYNSFLGGFALMRLAGEEYMNYSDNYFSTLSFFNDVIKNELDVAGRNVDNRYFDAFVGQNSFKKLYPIINKIVDENDLTIIAREERQIIQKDKISRLVNLNNLEKASYIVAVLNMFGVADESKKKKIDGLILSNFKSEIKPDKSEVVALCYGLNRGYAAFSNKYRSGDKEKIVKFELNSQVDYYTIESLFQFVFNNLKTTEGFPYIDSWCPKQGISSFKKKTDYQVLDVVVIGKKKPKVYSKEYLSNLLQLFFQKENELLFKEVFEKIRNIVYGDTYEEISEEMTSKDQEIKRLTFDSTKIRNLENENDQLKSEIQALNKRSKDLGVNYQRPLINQSKAEEPLNFDKKTFVKHVLQYKEKSKTMLEKEAKEKGIVLPKGAKLDDIIVLLMTMPSNLSNSELPFNE